jgi:hypothetical protein
MIYRLQKIFQSFCYHLQNESKQKLPKKTFMLCMSL